METPPTGRPQGLFGFDSPASASDHASVSRTRSGTTFSTGFDDEATSNTKLLSGKMTKPPSSLSLASVKANLAKFSAKLHKIIDSVANFAKTHFNKGEQTNLTPTPTAVNTPPTLEQIRSDTALKAKFYEFAQGLHCEENLDFLDLLDNSTLITSNPQGFLKEVSNRLDLDSEKTVNLSHELKSEADDLAESWDSSKGTQLTDLVTRMREEINGMVTNDTLRLYKP